MVSISQLCAIKSFRELDIGTHLSFKYEYIYFQVSKSASSTIKYYLQELEVRGTQRKVVDVNNRNLSPHIWPSQLKEDHFLELLVSPTVRKVTFVRNPFSRLLSCYLHRIKGAPESPSVKNIKRFTRNRFDAKLSFTEFIQIVCDQTSMQQDSHWRLQSDEVFYDFIPHWSFIGKVERIGKDLPRLMALLDPSSPILTSKLDDYSPSITRASSKLVDFYTPELERMVVARYKADFDNFGYSTSIEFTS